MVTETILKPIGKGQITIPLEWRKHLWIDQKKVKATFEGTKIIIEPVEKEELNWDIRKISLNELNEETQAAILESEKDYKAGNKDAFLSHNEFWN